jgi:hypothetical protein
MVVRLAVTMATYSAGWKGMMMAGTMAENWVAQLDKWLEMMRVETMAVSKVVQWVEKLAVMKG